MLSFIFALLLPGLWAQKTPTAQAERGMAVFNDPAKGCAGCHALAGKGTAVGPDLKGIARVFPRGIAIAINASRTQYVQEVEPKGAPKFPGMPAGKDGANVKFYDLSKTPPELKTFPAADVSTKDNQSWKHPAETMKMPPDQLADVVAYIKWAAYGDRKTVTPEEVK